MTTPVFPPLQHDPAIAAAGPHYAPAGLYAYSKSLLFSSQGCYRLILQAG